MAETYSSILPMEETSGSGRSVGSGGKAALRWVQAFWILALVVIGGATVFQDAVVTSIASTPHPEIVYIIFAVAGVAAIMLGIVLQDFLKEQSWFDVLRSASREDQDRMIAALPRTGSMAYFYRVYMQTRGMPLAIRQPAMEDEMSGVEAQMLGRLAMPNLLSGSLVGLGLVGTFIGLLQTLDELSGVFAALGGGSGGDSSALFSTMIVKLQGPMQGMGTAFVASLYGLLGSLVIGLTVSSVKSAGERLFRDVREFINEELYPAGGALVVGTPVVGVQTDGTDLNTAFSPQQSAILQTIIREEHEAMRGLFVQWESSFSKRFDQLSNVATHINHQLVDAVNTAGAQAERNTQQLKLVTEAEGRLASAIDDKGGRFVDQIDSLRKDLSVAQHGAFPVFGRLALAFAVIGAIAGLAAAVLSLGSGSAATPPKAAPAAVVAPSAAPATAPAPTADVATKAASNTAKAPEQVIVVEGDSLSGIAIRRGVSVEAMIAANPQLGDPARLYPGDTVNLPMAE